MSSGIVVGVPFEGELVRHSETGAVRSATDAEFLVEDYTGNWKRETVQISPDGGFKSRLILEFDGQDRCINGRVVSRQILLPIDVRVKAPDCEIATIKFSGASEKIIVDLHCR